MFWDKKEDKHLPDLPPLKSGLQGKTMLPPSSDIHEEDSEDLSTVERHGLPSFPDSPMTKGFSQAAIKDAIVDDSAKDGETIGFPQEPKSFKVVEVDDESPLTSSPPLLPALSSKGFSSLPARPTALPEPVIVSKPVTSEVVAPAFSSASKGSDVFVKIDRFHSARRALNGVQSQLESVDSLLKKIRETKMREEQEFSAWEKDMVQAKSKIEEVSKNIFDKTD